jgi:hypothetical protein
VSNDTATNPFLSQEVVHDELKLPELGDFQYGSLQDLPSLEQSEATDDEFRLEETTAQLEKDVKDNFDLLWEDIVTEPSFGHELKLLSWEGFQESGRAQERSAYLSEAGKSAFDVALHLQGKDGELPASVSVVRNDVFLRSLFALGLGRSSALFRYDTKKKNFERIEREHSVSSLSKQSVDSIVEKLTNCGRLVRHLRDFVERTYASGKAYPAKVALANAIATIIDALETQLTSSERGIISVLQLQDHFERPHRMLAEVYDLARAVRNARTNEDLASMVYKRCQNCDQEPDWLRSMMLQLLDRVSQPWLDIAEQWVGFKDDIGLQLSGYNGTFVDCETPSTKTKDDESDTPHELLYAFRPDKLPSFISPEDGQMIFDLGRDVRILRTHHPEHPLAKTQVALDNRIGLKWQNNWDDVERVAQKAKDFQTALTRVVGEQHSKRRSTREANSLIETPAAVDDEVFDPFALAGLNADLHISASPDELFSLIRTSVDHANHESQRTLADFSPPTAIMPVLSFNPLLLAQQRVLNAVMIRLFFRSHHLRLHLDLQRHFHLFGDGVFVSRLTAALFDPDSASTERQRGVMRSGSGMGLRLGSRGTWPPASSELRLALMGILSDRYHDLFTRGTMQHKAAGSSKQDLPGSLSFAIRQLAEEEAERILDADSLHALDFLRLQYSPPSPLGAIVTPASLDRYDTIFKFLLRLTRLLFVVAHLPNAFRSRKARLFRWQADAFVTTCCRYFFETGVKETWSVFVRYLDSIERRLKEEDDAGELGTRMHEGIDDMRSQHDLCLDRISFALLLRIRQQKVMKVLEDVLTTILEFSMLCHATEDLAELNLARVGELHKEFNDNAKLFLDVCRGLAGKRAYGKTGGDTRGRSGGKSAQAEENTVERLVVALDYSGFYERCL